MDQSAETQKQRTQLAFNALAADYETGGTGPFAQFGRRLVEAAAVGPGHHVLDVATGRGAVLFPSLERVGPTGRVVGVDLADAMVQATEAEARRRGLAVRLLPMDAEQLDFPDAGFDRVLCGFGIMFFPNAARALQEFRRVLRPGGTVGVSTWQVSQSEDLAAVLAALGRPPGQPPGWITEPDRLELLLRAAGFQGIRVTVEAHEFRYADLDQYWETARGTGQRAAIDGLDAAQRQAVRATLEERLRPRQRADGLYIEARALIATGR